MIPFFNSLSLSHFFYFSWFYLPAWALERYFIFAYLLLCIILFLLIVPWCFFSFLFCLILIAVDVDLV